MDPTKVSGGLNVAAPVTVVQVTVPVATPPAWVLPPQPANSNPVNATAPTTAPVVQSLVLMVLPSELKLAQRQSYHTVTPSDWVGAWPSNQVR